MKNYIAQISTPSQQLTTPNTNNQTVGLDVIIALIAGGIGALGIPKLVQMFASDKVEGAKDLRRRDDGVYQALFTSQEAMLKAMTQMNSTMMAGQSSSTAESFQLMGQLIQEIALIREVVANNTRVMEQVRDTDEALTQQLHEVRVAGDELRTVVLDLKDHVTVLGTEVSLLTHRV